VNWLRARAKQHRWAEELALTKNEMEWVTRFFLFKSKQWRQWGENMVSTSTGQTAYKEKQMAMWEEMGEQAYSQFIHARPDWDVTLETIQLEYKQ